jgi:hypothetical protein
MNNKENRTELVSLWMTPEAAREINAVKDNDKLKDQIIKTFIQREKDWLESEITEMDEYTVRYRAKLLTIRDSFEKAQGSYQDELEAIFKSASDTFSKIGGLVADVKATTDIAMSHVTKLRDNILYIDVDRLERLLTAVERYNSMRDDEKELIKLIIQGK